MQTLSLFDPMPTATPKERGMAQAWSGTSDEWKVEAFEAVKELCRTRAEFTADDLEAVAKGTHEPRAIGALLVKASKAGMCVKTNRMMKSRIDRCHNREKAVWRSLIVGAP